ncbi:methyl-accepting chemotaxis protein [Paenibacillus puldeungensis]|uniref:Methyl-accepting chemotaxis protein n=1 Tax=Paenibacillus puldeungensis TaxID=696536 RepID=A0ABW3RX43_9BACL
MGKLFKSIRTKITIWFLVVSLVPLIASSVFSYSLSSQKLIENEKESMQSLVSSKAQGMNEWLDRRMAEIQLASVTEILQSASPARITPYLIQIQKQSSVYEDIGFAKPSGIVTASSDEGSTGINLGERLYFQKGMKGEASVSEVLTSLTTGKRIIVMASPVKAGNGKVIGLLYASVNFEALVDAFLTNKQADQNQSTDTEVVLVDENHLLQAVPDQSLIGKSVNEANFDTTLTELLQKGSKESGTGTYSQKGKEYLLAYSPIPKTGYGLYFSVPMTAVLESAKSVQTGSIIVMGIAAILILFLSLYISGTISKPIMGVTEELKRVAKGDLSEFDVKIKRKDEIGALWFNLQKMTSDLRELMHKIFAASQQVAAAAQQISASTEEIASGSTDQAHSAQTINHLVKELSLAIESVAEDAEEASELSNRTEQIAQDGGKVVSDSIEGMTTVNDQMAQLEMDSNQIGDIIEVIDDIAEQTNLLALNAAIEAARAGDQGRGFAVVADEVRKLAERSGEATKQITAIIKGMQNNTGLSVKSVSEAVEKTSRIREAFDNIVQMVNLSAQKVNEIAAASEEQSAQSKEVLLSIESISAASEEAAAASEQTASTTQSLAKIAEDLHESVSFFKLN